jgi:Spy/CpxP family protein refolding chaperone
MCHSHSHHGGWAREHHAGCGCGPRHAAEHFAHHHFGGGDPAGGFGVRRPLRFLAWKLGLDEPQLEQLAAIINELRTERAQAAVDDRRALALLADAVAGDSFDAAKAAEAARLRTESQDRLQKRVAEALSRMHQQLQPDQRNRLAYLLRTGTLAM